VFPGSKCWFVRAKALPGRSWRTASHVEPESYTCRQKIRGRVEITLGFDTATELSHNLGRANACDG